MKKTFSVGITQRFFDSIAHQRLAAHEAICEPIDNAIANSGDGQTQILISVDEGSKDDKSLIRFTIADWGNGMDEKALINAIQFGSEHTRKEGPLCVYGMGLCNFLLVMSQNKYDWMIASKPRGEDKYNVVKGPFALKMHVDTGAELPLRNIVMREKLAAYGEPSTVVSVVTDIAVASTMVSKKGEIAPSYVSNGRNVLRVALAEHLGVKYRGYLANNAKYGMAAAKILLTDFVHKDKTRDDIFLSAIEPPYRSVRRLNTPIMAVVEGYNIPIYVKYGLLDKNGIDTLVAGEYPAKHYYTYSTATQGYDIAIGKRVIATAQLDSIWGFARHPSYNATAGEIVIDIESSGAPRNLLNTLSNKSDIDVNDPNWKIIFDAIRWVPAIMPQKIEEDCLSQYKENICTALQQKYPKDSIVCDQQVYANRAKVDILDIKQGDNFCNIYMVKKGTANIHDLSALMTLWNGVHAQGLQPLSAKLICRKVGVMLGHTVNEWNEGVQTMSSADLKKALDGVGGDVSKLPQYNFEIITDPNMPV